MGAKLEGKIVERIGLRQFLSQPCMSVYYLHQVNGVNNGDNLFIGFVCLCTACAEQRALNSNMLRKLTAV